MQKCWSLYNKEEKLRIDDLRADQVKTILLAIPTSRMGDWYACSEGDLHWQSLSDIPEFYEDAKAIRGESLPPAKKTPARDGKVAGRRPLFEDVRDEQDTTLQVESVQTKERRTARRYVRNLKFQLIHGGKKFECATQDVSMSGISLKNKLPAGVPKTFRAKLSLQGSNVLILAHKVTDTTIKIAEADAWDVLRSWIANW
jgi:hypothetical protein